MSALNNILKFIIIFPSYFSRRGNQLYVFSIAAFEVVLEKTGLVKNTFVSNFFWGRSNFYRNAFHFGMLTTTIFVVSTGLINRIVQQENSIVLSADTYNDILNPGIAISASDPLDPKAGLIRLKTHIVEETDTLDSIAKKYNLEKSTVRWANIKLLGPFSDNLELGWELKIPNSDGVLYTVKPTDTIFTIARDLKSDVFVISEINAIEQPDYLMTPGQQIFVPEGKLSSWDSDVNVTEEHLVGAFEDPLIDPACNGYQFYGGIESYPGHNGIDLGYPGGCPINAIAAGTVYYTGWEDVSGYTVKVDHGGGLKSYYYHGNGEIWVKNGEHVEQGQPLMMMGNSGNSRGTHLHLTIRLNNRIIDPEKYIKLKY
jgi:murein DD-endopeptidase MepM/ murein hydrolase activator NlpD